jgi:hypothetical protein
MNYCVAAHCLRQIDRDRLMCMDHWQPMPLALKRRILAHYPAGQGFMEAVREAVEYVYNLEAVGRRVG